ncbi:hypothetical protein FS837_012415 [Tulasnella sp. UAMH 9824]|nr:hypothetical protein FS837_012415 [Tulasnella sp. UAMH 9824]
MIFGALLGVFSWRDIARRIGHAEERFTGMTFDMTFKADSLSAEKREEDVKLIEIMQDCIGHRLERLRLSFFSPREPCTGENWWKISWLRGARKGDISVPIERHERRLVKIEIMLYLIENHHKYDSKFWFDIVKWQLEDYQRVSKKCLEHYDKFVAQLKQVESSHIAYRAALATAVENALAEPEALAADVDWTDVFTIRHISFDPALKGVIDSNWTPEQDRQNFMKTIDEVLLEEPHFPPGYRVLLLGTNREPTLFVSRSQITEALLGPSTLFMLFLLVITQVPETQTGGAAIGDAQPSKHLSLLGYKIVDGAPWLVSPCKLDEFTLCDAVRSLAYLHSFVPPIFHSGIKPNGILVQDNFEFALCDLRDSEIPYSFEKLVPVVLENPPRTA